MGQRGESEGWGSWVRGGRVRVRDRGSDGESQGWGESGLGIVGQMGRVRVRDRGSDGESQD